MTIDDSIDQPSDELIANLDDDGVLLLTLNRPHKKNALNDAMVAGLIEHLRDANNNEAVRSILLAAAGDDFCSGFDIVGRNAGDDRPRAGAIQRRLPSQAHQLIPMMLETQVPIVAAARGWVAGIGLNLALAADFVVVADDATLWCPFSARGFTPDSGAAWLLPHIVGPVRARELLVLGRQLDGATAVAWNLVHRAVPRDEVDETAHGLAVELARGPTVALGLTKWLINTGLTTPLRDHLAHEALAMEVSSRASDFKEGLRAFVEKRPPRFEGR